jgi:hypothetical protein
MKIGQIEWKLWTKHGPSCLQLIQTRTLRIRFSNFWAGKLSYYKTWIKERSDRVQSDKLSFLHSVYLSWSHWNACFFKNFNHLYVCVFLIPSIPDLTFYILNFKVHYFRVACKRKTHTHTHKENRAKRKWRNGRLSHTKCVPSLSLSLSLLIFSATSVLSWDETRVTQRETAQIFLVSHLQLGGVWWHITAKRYFKNHQFL